MSDAACETARGAPSSGPHIVVIDARTTGSNASQLRALARAYEPRQWPFSSRSYRFPLAVVACHHAPVGIDIERITPCDEAFADSIRTPSERSAGWPASDPDRFFTSLWSSKEALAKALGDALRYDPRWLEGPAIWPDGRAGPWNARALTLDQDYVGWVCWRDEPVMTNVELNAS